LYIVIYFNPNGSQFHADICKLCALQTPQGELELYSVYVPTNHVYVGDIFLLGKDDIIKPNLSVREGLEIVVSVGMAIPPNLIALGKD
jgi:uncharacterized membrane protein